MRRATIAVAVVVATVALAGCTIPWWPVPPTPPPTPPEPPAPTNAPALTNLGAVESDCSHSEGGERLAVGGLGLKLQCGMVSPAGQTAHGRDLDARAIGAAGVVTAMRNADGTTTLTVKDWTPAGSTRVYRWVWLRRYENVAPERVTNGAATVQTQSKTSTRLDLYRVQ